MRKVIILAVGILVLGAGLNIFFSIRDSVVDAEDEITLTENFENIEILVENASVNIYPTSDSTTTVKFEGKMKSKSRYKFTADVQKDTLQVELTDRKWISIGINFTPFSNKLDVYVPEKTYKKILAESENGALSVEDLKAEELHFQTDNGRIYLKEVESKVYANTHNGRIHLDHVDGDIEAMTNNGRIELHTETLNHDINLKTNNGRILVESEDEPTNATIEADTDNGKISVYGHSNKHTVFGEGKNKVTIETDNGSITVK